MAAATAAAVKDKEAREAAEKEVAQLKATASAAASSREEEAAAAASKLSEVMEQLLQEATAKATALADLGTARGRIQVLEGEMSQLQGEWEAQATSHQLVVADLQQQLANLRDDLISRNQLAFTLLQQLGDSTAEKQQQSAAPLEVAGVDSVLALGTEGDQQEVGAAPASPQVATAVSPPSCEVQRSRAQLQELSVQLEAAEKEVRKQQLQHNEEVKYANLEHSGDMARLEKLGAPQKELNQQERNHRSKMHQLQVSHQHSMAGLQQDMARMRLAVRELKQQLPPDNPKQPQLSSQQQQQQQWRQPAKGPCPPGAWPQGKRRGAAYGPRR
jgi:hypothetical protein